MLSCQYLKKLIQQKGYTLTQVEKACGFPKKYLSQLLSQGNQLSNMQTMQAVYLFLGLQFPSKKKIVGVIFGKLYPLHIGHIYFIQRASSQVDKLHVILRYDDQRDLQLFKNSATPKQPSMEDRLRWLLQTFKYQTNISIHVFNEKIIEPYKGSLDLWTKSIKKFMLKQEINAHFIYSHKHYYITYGMNFLGIKTVIIKSDQSFMSIHRKKIRQHPFRYWNYIPAAVKPFFVRTVALIGGESSGKSIMVNKLANVFNTTSTWEYGRDYVYHHLGGNEMALQYSDYDKIAIGQAQFIDCAIKHANKVTFIDTDFITSQAFCQKYHGREHPIVQAMINEYRFDLVILLKNNTPWIDDGLRSLSRPSDRYNFQRLLKILLHNNHVPYVRVDSSNYETRFLHCF